MHESLSVMAEKNPWRMISSIWQATHAPIYTVFLHNFDLDR
jgi:hypothetical protein